MNPRIFRVYEKAYSKGVEEQDHLNWALGQYFYAATYSAVGQLFVGEKFKPIYPDKPYSVTEKTKERRKETEEERIEKKLQAFIAAEEAWIRNEKSRGLPDVL